MSINFNTRLVSLLAFLYMFSCYFLLCLVGRKLHGSLTRNHTRKMNKEISEEKI